VLLYCANVACNAYAQVHVLKTWLVVPRTSIPRAFEACGTYKWHRCVTHTGESRPSSCSKDMTRRRPTNLHSTCCGGVWHIQVTQVCHTYEWVTSYTEVRGSMSHVSETWACLERLSRVSNAWMSPIFCQKRPTFCQKSPTFMSLEHEHVSKGSVMSQMHEWALYSAKRALYSAPGSCVAVCCSVL